MAAVALLVFVAVFCTVLGVYALHAGRDSAAAHLRKRLQALPAEEQEEERGGSALLKGETDLERLFMRLPPIRWGAGLLGQAGVQTAPLPVLFSVALAGCVLCAVTYLWRGEPFTPLVVLVLTVGAPVPFLLQRKKKRLEKFTEQLPDALSIMSRSLRAGHSLSGAVELAGEELPEPSRSLFKLAYDQQKLGMRMADSLCTLLQRIDSIDLQFLVTIIRINNEAGGNLSEVLDKLAETVRSRLQIRRQVDVYTAEGRISGVVLVLLPVVVFFFFHLTRPEYVAVFFKVPMCQLWLAGAACAQVIGYLIIRRIVNIRI